MQIEYSTDIHFPVGKVSLQQLASLWSAVMACLPEVRRCSAEFNRRGRVTGSYVYNDPDELAHADLDVRPGELELRYIHISGPDIDVTIGQHWDTSFWGMLLFKSTALNVCISGSNERDILKLRTPLEQWGEHNLETNRLTLWLKTGARGPGFPDPQLPRPQIRAQPFGTHHHTIVRRHLAHLSGLHPFGLIISSLSNNGASTSPSLAFGTPPTPRAPSRYAQNRVPSLQTVSVIPISPAFSMQTFVVYYSGR